MCDPPLVIQNAGSTEFTVAVPLFRIVTRACVESGIVPVGWRKSTDKVRGVIATVSSSRRLYAANPVNMSIPDTVEEKLMWPLPTVL